LQAIVWQRLADSGRPAKKSCRKTYRRFFYFRQLCYHHASNDENDKITRKKNEKMVGREKATVFPKAPDDPKG